MELHRTPPALPEIEAALIGLMLLDNSVIPDVIDRLQPGHFYVPKHEMIVKAAFDIYHKGGAADIVTVCAELERTKLLTQAGGAYEVATITNQPASLLNLTDIIDALLEKAAARSLITTCQRVQAMAFDPSQDFSETVKAANDGVDAINDMATLGNKAMPIGEAAANAHDEILRGCELVKEGKVIGIPTGLQGLDTSTAGWKGSELIILAGRPGMGKTALLLHFAKAAAVAGTPVVMYSLEMSAMSLATRMLLSICDADPYRVKSRTLTAGDKAELLKARKTLEMYPIIIDDNPVVSMHYIRSNARALARRGKCGLVMIDYLQLAEMPQAKNENRERAVAASTRLAKITAKELDIPVILVSQLNRKSEEKGDKKPMLSHLRESGAIEQDADIVAMVHRPEIYDDNAEKGAGLLMIEKHRDGATGELAFRYNANLTKIWDYTKAAPDFVVDDGLPF